LIINSLSILLTYNDRQYEYNTLRDKIMHRNTEYFPIVDPIQ